MKETMQAIGACLGILALILALAWILQGNDFFLYKAFAPKYEQVRRETFEQTRSYNHGMIQELQNMQYQYIQADKSHKEALASIILHRSADYPEDKMPADLRDFIRGLKRDRELGR
ncbi:MAG: hypothetical protein NTW50_02050 [Candidatus Berkelbacteria bacterium]|nr:hypothetical protein [Candidatus Berkelbacteria bacterium]